MQSGGIAILILDLGSRFEGGGGGVGMINFMSGPLYTPSTRDRAPGYVLCRPQSRPGPFGIEEISFFHHKLGPRCVSRTSNLVAIVTELSPAVVVCLRDLF